MLEGLERPSLDEDTLNQLREWGRILRGDIIKMTSLAGSGHPGGSMSSIDLFLVTYCSARINPHNPYDPDRDRVVVSHGHTSPGVYAVLGRLGFFDIDSAISTFRLAGSPFEGHIERCVPGIEWTTGNLGQGLSVGCGFALAGKLLKKEFHTFVLMSDAEQCKGQVAEARRVAHKYNLNNITVIIDYNDRQISGKVSEIMPINIRAVFEAESWYVIDINGHDYSEIYTALHDAMKINSPVAIIGHTVIGKGVSFMEGDEQFHGRALKPDEYKKALAELDIEDDLERYRQLRNEPSTLKSISFGHTPGDKGHAVLPDAGNPITYTPEDNLDNRTAFGKALENLIAINKEKKTPPVAVFDCDLAGSVKTNLVWKSFPDYFFELGVQEHNTATIAGAISTQGVVSFFADFGVFGIDETYNQHRLNDINFTNLKLVTTHNGIDVGQDGKAHQCIDYIGVVRNLYGFKVIVPCDPNQTDRVIRYIATTPGNFLIVMGRSKTPVIADEKGEPYFGNDYTFEYGKADIIFSGRDAAIITMGQMLSRALTARKILKEEHSIETMVIHMSCPLTIDEEAIGRAASTGLVVTYEDHNVHSGLGSIVADYIAEKGLRTRLIKMGITEYLGSGLPENLFRMASLNPEQLVSTIKNALSKKKP
ncbi:transketolase [Candidatus Sumerlaeota bacterium]|nr:transketolase [Candidatus Sumerlaeota bacterium]